MKALTGFVIALVLLGGCGTAAQRQAAPGTTAFSGEVWTWDEQANTITLRQGVNTIRVNVTPDQFRGLTLHQNATIRGTLAQPAELERVMMPAPASYSVVPKGAPQQAEITGKVVSVTPAGVAAVDSARGPLQVWVATPSASQFRQGGDVRVRVNVQPVDIVPRATGAAADAVAASPSSEPGDYAVVVGRVVRVEPAGKLVIESPRGPVEVWVSDASRFRANDMVQVRTSIHPI